MATGVTADELVAVNSAINNHDYWTLTNNCSSFAGDVWNAGNSGRTLTESNPSSLANSIKSYSGFTTNPTIPSKSLKSIAYQTSNSIQYDSTGASGY